MNATTTVGLDGRLTDDDVKRIQRENPGRLVRVWRTADGQPAAVQVCPLPGQWKSRRVS